MRARVSVGVRIGGRVSVRVRIGVGVRVRVHGRARSTPPGCTRLLLMPPSDT